MKQNEIKNLNNQLKNYKIENTKLIIRQDTTNIKKSILEEINKDKSQMDEKDLRIAQLEKTLQEETYNNEVIFDELKILFPEIESISIANHIFYKNNEEREIIPTMIYESKNDLSIDSKEKIKKWLIKRLNKTNFEIVRKK